MASLGGNFIENSQIQLEIEEIQLFYWLVYPCTSLRTDQPVLARSLEGRFNLLKGSKVDSGFKQVILLPQSSEEAKKYVPHEWCVQPRGNAGAKLWVSWSRIRLHWRAR
jgi:hypothetical protein